ncbi:MAG: alpha amylase N-terminal ig-like domain-containing protein [Candidatus Carbobacillus altaicus]|nr:alpha amylase N-terminal ig-like domain-containing protein [Candidatus Carbobacillus altaicus]
MRIPEVLHDLTPRYVYPIDETHLVLRLKSRRKSVQKVTVIYGDRYQPDTEDDRRSMRKMGHDSQYDYWQCVLEFPKRRARYQFLLETDTARFWYGEIGVGHTRDDAGYFYYPYLHRGEALKVPDWAVGSIVYQIFPDRFAKGDPTLDPPNVADWEKDFPTPHNVFGGDLQGVINHLDDLQALGVDVLYFTPIFLSPSNHKYDTTDYYRIDPHFGDEQTLKKLVEEAHRRGIRVILDAVFNHSGYDFFAFRDVREKGNRSPYRDWFFLESEEQSIASPPGVKRRIKRRIKRRVLRSKQRSLYGHICRSIIEGARFGLQ